MIVRERKVESRWHEMTIIKARFESTKSFPPMIGRSLSGSDKLSRAFLALTKKETKQQRDELPFENVCAQIEVEGLLNQIRIDIAAAATPSRLRQKKPR